MTNLGLTSPRRPRRLAAALSFSRAVFPLGACLWIFGLGVTHGAATTSGEIDFLRDVRPILAAKCLKCHGPDDEARKAKLRLDIRDIAVQPAKSGARPIVPGKPEESEVVRRIFATDDDDRLPPPAAKNPLSD